MDEVKRYKFPKNFDLGYFDERCGKIDELNKYDLTNISSDNSSENYVGCFSHNSGVSLIVFAGFREMSLIGPKDKIDILKKDLEKTIIGGGLKEEES